MDCAIDNPIRFGRVTLISNSLDCFAIARNDTELPSLQGGDSRRGNPDTNIKLPFHIPWIASLSLAMTPGCRHCEEATADAAIQMPPDSLPGHAQAQSLLPIRQTYAEDAFQFVVVEP